MVTTPKRLSKHRLKIPCRECKGTLVLPMDKDKGTLKCAKCGWEVEYVLEDA